MILVEMENVRKSFPLRHGPAGEGRFVPAVDGVDLTIVAGENLGLVGESGSGKTTVGRLIVRLYRPDSGKVILCGTDISALPERRLRPLRRNVQMVFQDPYSSLDPRQAIHGILQEALTLEGRALAADRQFERMEEALLTVGLGADCLVRFPHEFSGGERQRIAMARSLMMNPRLLILDEAVSSLDVLIQEQIVQLLMELQARFPVTYLFISHNLRIVRRLCRRIAVMYKGRIVELAATGELFRNPLHPYTQMLLKAAIDYVPSETGGEFAVAADSPLIDKGDGHFVIN